MLLTVGSQGLLYRALDRGEFVTVSSRLTSVDPFITIPVCYSVFSSTKVNPDNVSFVSAVERERRLGQSQLHELLQRFCA